MAPSLTSRCVRGREMVINLPDANGESNVEVVLVD